MRRSIDMSMTEAFDHFFMIRKQFFEKYRNVDLPQPMIPIVQSEQINFEEIEIKLGFTIHHDIKAFLSAYWFDMIEGFFVNRYVNIHGVLNIESVINDITAGFDMGDKLFLSDARYWYLGGCDPYSLYVNNTTGEVMAIIPYENEAILISDSISNLIMHLKCETGSEFRGENVDECTRIS